MGNEKSAPFKYNLKEVIQITDGWIQKNATTNDGYDINIFEKASNGKDLTDDLLYKFSKNLMLHRHPCILKYISSWYMNGKYYVATEAAIPLSQILESQTPLQLCVGLYNILKAIIFLHEKALSSHNNICRDAIYVAIDGTWKLGRMEFLCKFSDLSKNYLSKICQNTTTAIISKIENSTLSSTPCIIDTYAFSILVEDILGEKTNDDIPAVVEFKEYCKNHLQSLDKISAQISLSQLMTRPFFTHRFVAIYAFLVELPLKPESEKTDFFKTLAEELVLFPEELIAKQLSTLLLSRLVLLNSAAQKHLLPRLLQLKDDKYPDGIFTKNVAVKYIAPCLLNIFSVRDVHIRLILLKYFSQMCNFFTHEQLRNYILPELLVGVRDINEMLIESTLHAIAILVPILGASTVIGKNRTKIFSDGRPAESVLSTKTSPQENGNFPPDKRPSPEGGENTVVNEDENDCWSDWEIQNDSSKPQSTEFAPIENGCENGDGEKPMNHDNIANFSSLKDDIKIFDIKIIPPCPQVVADIDELLEGMQPKISKAQVCTVINKSSKFEAKNLSTETALGCWEDHNINFEDNNSEKNDTSLP